MTTIKVSLGPDETELLAQLAERHPGTLVVSDCDPVAVSNLCAIGLAETRSLHIWISGAGMTAWKGRTFEGGSW